MGAAGSVLDDEKLITTPTKEEVQNTVARDRSKDVTPTFEVSLGFWPGDRVTLPEKFKLKISYESLDFVRLENGTPLVQFPFQNIICWGSSLQNFQFKVFDLEKSEIEKRDTGILISLKTTQGKTIEEATMANVKKLMIDMNDRAISKQEYAVLLQSIFDVDNNSALRDNWLSTIDQFTSSGRLFLAKQGMELMVRISPLAPFDKFDLACLIYERMINKNSFQLIINTFEDKQERENLIHRLKLNLVSTNTTNVGGGSPLKTSANATTVTGSNAPTAVVADCAILPERPASLT